MATYKPSTLPKLMGVHRPLGQDMPTHGVDLARADTIPPTNIRWIWRGYLAKAKLTVMAGPAGTGKTGLAMAIAAIVSAGSAQGRTFPDGSTVEQGNVVIWSGEDGVEDTLIPRLIANGADMPRVNILRGMRTAGRSRRFDFATDLPALDLALHDVGPVSLIIIDSVAQATTGDTNSNRAVRRGLEALLELAVRHDCVLLGLTHVNKGSKNRDPVERVTGSLAFGAVPRVVLLTAKSKAVDGDTPPPSVLVRCKTNVGEDGGGFEYWTDSAQVYGQEGEVVDASRIRWGERPLEGSASDILRSIEAPGLDAKSSVVDRATEFLIRILRGGALPYPELMVLAKAENISEAAIKRARNAGQPAIHSEKMQGAGPASPFLWSLEGYADLQSDWRADLLGGLPNSIGANPYLHQTPQADWRPHARVPSSFAPYVATHGPFASVASVAPHAPFAPFGQVEPVALVEPFARVGYGEPVEPFEPPAPDVPASSKLPLRGAEKWGDYVNWCVTECKTRLKGYTRQQDDEPDEVATSIGRDVVNELISDSIFEYEYEDEDKEEIAVDQFVRDLRRDVDATAWWT